MNQNGVLTHEQAITQVKEGKFFENPEILKLCNNTGWSIAHEQVSQG